MAFGISGIGASQVAASPQVFQGLSLAGRAPVQPASSFGTPRSLNLTAAAQPIFDALARIGQSPSGRPPATFSLLGPLPTGVPALSNINAPPLSVFAIKSIVQTVTNLAVASVYPRSIFVFHA